MLVRQGAIALVQDQRLSRTEAPERMCCMICDGEQVINENRSASFEDARHFTGGTFSPRRHSPVVKREAGEHYIECGIGERHLSRVNVLELDSIRDTRVTN